ncbi:tRNA pseudouridine synthase B [Acidocella aquatica]|uniref:tRNA pseudouridine synthase B n=1 Tax=Acidocella aquatica TaxID=1922313 RepID=A0ABQ6AB12_9PROT|nr:tRNA pseudouridine(55) synthase TruB [Acidocella aquatica]GLR67319.1 tRNA pseudouridine synthase B [Acidocella aquatica]
MAKQKRGRKLDGWLILDKPQGITSTQAVNKVKRALDAQKAGHGGTLDPLATGILPIALGNATKTVPYVMDGTKLYHFTIRFGEARDTDDAEGAVTATSDARPTDEQIRAALPAFRGSIMQIPPAFSAIKVDGERAYDLARAGAPPELPARPAQVDRFELIGRPDADTAEFEVESGKGVYMRSLARDLSAACGTVGHIVVLRRLRVGPFLENMAVSMDTILDPSHTPQALAELVRPLETALDDIPALALTAVEAHALSQGQPINLVDLMGRIPDAANPDEGLVRVLAAGRVLALARLSDGWLKPERLIQQFS